MAAIIQGSNTYVETSRRAERSDREAEIVTIEGPYENVANQQGSAGSFLTNGYSLESSVLSSTGDGCGKLTVRGIKYESGSSFSAARTTFRVDMLEVCYDLEDHPNVSDGRGTIVRWLATDEAKRIRTDSAGVTKYYYTDDDGVSHEISSGTSAYKFIVAYLAGIKTFMRYYPVIERIGIYKNPPGMSQSGGSFSGGSPTFSENIGKYDTPPLTLNGFGSSNFFKSKDSWVQNADTTWTRTEQWTYTPEASNGSNGWIYNNLTSNANASS